MLPKISTRWLTSAFLLYFLPSVAQAGDGDAPHRPVVGPALRPPLKLSVTDCDAIGGNWVKQDCGYCNRTTTPPPPTVPPTVPTTVPTTVPKPSKCIDQNDRCRRSFGKKAKGSCVDLSAKTYKDNIINLYKEFDISAGSKRGLCVPDDSFTTPAGTTDQPDKEDCCYCLKEKNPVKPVKPVKPSFWSPWGKWTTCSKTCGGGRRYRTRTCNGGTCLGDKQETVVCNTDTCPDTCKLADTKTAPWIALSTGCYLQAKSRTRAEAKVYCEEKNGYLVEVTSQEEQDALAGKFGTMGQAWTGLRKIDDKWVWETSGTPLGYSNWRSGEPSGDGVCMEINYGFAYGINWNGEWNDEACTGKRESICELTSPALIPGDNWLPSGRCGPRHLLPNGKPGQCDPNGNANEVGPCCSPLGWCGNSDDHCKCIGCQDFSKDTFKELNSGELCTTPLASEAECKKASLALGLTFAHAWNGPGDFPGCLHANDGRDKVYFNLSPNPSRTANNPKYGAICATNKTPEPAGGAI